MKKSNELTEFKRNLLIEKIESQISDDEKYYSIISECEKNMRPPVDKLDIFNDFKLVCEYITRLRLIKELIDSIRKEINFDAEFYWEEKTVKQINGLKKIMVKQRPFVFHCFGHMDSAKKEEIFNKSEHHKTIRPFLGEWFYKGVSG